MRLPHYVVALAFAHFLLAPAAAWGQVPAHGGPAAQRQPATLVQGLGGHTHPIRTSSSEAVFRADLERNVRNPRSLFGLWRSLTAQNKTTDAEWVRRQFEAAWQGTDAQLRLEDL